MKLFWKCKVVILLTVFLAFAGCASSAGSGGGNTAAQSKEQLMAYMTEMRGKGILAGQMDTSWSDTIDPVTRVFRDTGKYPAIKGFDYLHVRHPDWGGGGSKQTLDAIEWWNNSPVRGKNGIVTFCWHWRMPPEGDTRAGRDTYRPGFVIPLKDGELDKDDPKFALIQEDLDLVAAELAKLRDAGVPVLWRPLHEAAGGWFWWGTDRDGYLALWAYMYDYYTNEKGLDNLIWVWNGQNGSWYPDPDTVDVAGYDAYENNRERNNYEPNPLNEWRNYYVQLRAWAPGKLLALTENGVIPDPDTLVLTDTQWSWFMTWDDHSTVTGLTAKSNHWTGEWHNPNAHKRHVYRHRYVITLDKLPPFSR